MLLGMLISLDSDELAGQAPSINHQIRNNVFNVICEHNRFRFQISLYDRLELLGYTRYRDYLAHGKETLQGQVKLLTATVTRSEVYTRHIRQKKFVFSFDALMTIYYTAEYSFGYELKPESDDIRDTDAGIETVLGKPVLVATPAIKSRSHDTPSSSWLIDENKALVDLYEGMDSLTSKCNLETTNSAREGSVLASTPECNMAKVILTVNLFSR